MFGLFKQNPSKKLQQAYEKKLSEAMQAQRTGDIRKYSLLTEEAEAIFAQIKSLAEDPTSEGS
ncbi:MAG: Lacal_2735 family protein [Natronospirillum sp.]